MDQRSHIGGNAYDARDEHTGIMVHVYGPSTAINPEILLMDEWMSVGDSDFKRKAEMRLNSFISKAGIMVMATHDDELAKSVCNKFIRLEHGEIVSKGGF
ncbi:hypothetical protein GP167_004654, partial [Salmonella enterica]|nr:hypothetical protein [Salmonella enterica]